MRKAGITNYKAFARDILEAIPDRSISFELFSDEFADMERQALEIAGWDTKREPSYELVHKSAKRKVKLNVTALMTLGQVRNRASLIRGPGRVEAPQGRGQGSARTVLSHPYTE